MRKREHTFMLRVITRQLYFTLINDYYLTPKNMQYDELVFIFPATTLESRNCSDEENTLVLDGRGGLNAL